MQRPPNFFIVGAPKAGTTSLYHYLDQHPNIYMSPIKEPHYFASEIRPENCDPGLRDEMARESRGLREFLSGPMTQKRFSGIVTEWADYMRLFANANTESALERQAYAICGRRPHHNVLPTGFPRPRFS